MGIFLNLLFPEKNICFVCEEYGSDIEENLCSVCGETLISTNPISCSICGRKLEESYLDSGHIVKCSECIRHPHYFTKNVAPLSYEGDIKQLIYNFKYNNRSYMYKLFGQLMVKSIVANDLENVDLVVPVPLYMDREKNRGYNQAALLAKYISKQLKIELDTKNLKRITSTKAQNQLNRNQRVKNITGVFDLKEKNAFMQKKVLIIDDIYTTGSTIDGCSKLMLENGVKEVFSATIAITPNNKDDRGDI